MSGWVKPRNLHSSLNAYLRAQTNLLGMASGARVWFVDGVNGSDSYAGWGSPDAARETLGSVLGTSAAAATNGANAYDVVYVMDKGISGTDPNPYQEASYNCLIRVANVGMSVVGVSPIGLVGRPIGPQLKGESASQTTPVLQVNAPMCAFENLGFNRGYSTSGGIFLNDDGVSNYAFGTSIVNCSFVNVRGPDATAGTYGAIGIYGGYNILVDGCFFHNCRHGIAAAESGGTLQSLVFRNLEFTATAKANIGVGIKVAMSVGGGCNISNVNFGFNLPAYAASDAKFILITGTATGGIHNVSMGLAANGSTALTSGPNGTGITSPATMDIGATYSKGALAAYA
jgi:hypothetical protein